MAAPGSDMMSPVAKNQTWCERIKKEQQLTKIREEYSPNVGTLSFLTEAPTKTLGLPMGHPKYTDVPDIHPDDKKLMDKFEQTKLGPQRKYHWPQTEAQEVGWNTEPLMENPKEFYHPNGTCDITEYADAYVRSKGLNPFQNVRNA